MQEKGFSLIEISIVLLVVGLLTGLVLSGQLVMEFSKQRKLIGDLQKIKISVENFRINYSGIAGDLKNAYFFFGEKCTIDPLDCNGNGNKIIDSPDPYNPNRQEMFRAWQHLNLAGFFPGNYSGIASANFGGDPDDIEPGYNAPLTNYGGAFMILTSSSTFYSGAEAGKTEKRLFTRTGKIRALTEASQTNDYGIISAVSAREIDEKIDDGKPGTGDLIITEGQDFKEAPGNHCVIGSGFDNATNIEFTKDKEEISCVLNFLM